MLKKFFRNVFLLYYDGFRSMTIGKSLWIIIFIKLIIIFVVLKLFFFPDILKTKFSNDKDRSDYIIKELTKNN